MHTTPTALDQIAAAIVMVDGGLSLALFIGLTLFMSFGAMSQKANTVGLLVAFIMVITTAVAGVISLISPAPAGQLPPYTGDYIAAAFAIIVAGASILLIVGLSLVLAIPAIASRRELVTSWPQHAEASFQPYEQASARTGAFAWTLSLITAGAFFAIIAVINLTVEPKKDDLSRDMNMSNVSKKGATSAPAPTPTTPATPESPK
jgi:hypothetical protein